MSGLYDDGKRIPLLEHSVDRRSARQAGNDKLRSYATWLLAAFSVLMLLSGSNQEEAAWWTAAWYCSAAAILSVSGRVGMIAWIRWTTRGSGYTRYLLHKGRRLAPVHLLSIAIVLLCQSFLTLLVLADPMPWTTIGENIVPFMPSLGAWDVNPAWKILQIIVLGTVLLPVIRVLSFHVGTALSAGIAWALSGGMIFLTTDALWAEHLALLSCFLVSATAGGAAGKTRIARVSLMLACSALTITGLVVGANKPGIAIAMNYPALVLHWPILGTALALISHPNGDGALVATAAGFIVLLATSYVIGRYVECRVDSLSAQDGEQAHQSSRYDSEKSDFTSNPS